MSDVIVISEMCTSVSFGVKCIKLAGFVFKLGIFYDQLSNMLQDW